MEKAWIPRNLNEDDNIQLGLGIKVKVTDIPFFLATGIPTFLLTQDSDMLVQVASMLAALGWTYFGLRCKYKGQDLPEICLNRLIYSQRKRKYKRGV
jgi:hypothetical protein